MKCRTCRNEMEIRQTDTGKVAICHHCKVKRRLVKKSENRPAKNPTAQTYSNIPERAVREKAERDVRTNYDNMITAGSGRTAKKRGSDASKQLHSSQMHKKKKKDNRLLTVIITVILLVFLVVGGYFGFRFVKSNFFNSNKKTTTGDGTVKNDINISTDSFSVEYIKHEASKDVNGKPCLLVYYNFTNKQKDITASALTTVRLAAYQNTAECSTAILPESNEEVANGLIAVKNGDSLAICQAYVMTDTSDITLKVSDLLSTDQKHLGEQVITL